MSDDTEQIEAQLCAYIDGELDESARRQVEHQLAANARHRQLLEELKQVRQLLAELPRQSAPPEIEEAVSHHIERSLLLDEKPGVGGAPLRMSHRPQILSAAAILMLAVGLGVIVWLVIRPPHERTTTVSMTPPPPTEIQTEATPSAARQEQPSQRNTPASAMQEDATTQPLAKQRVAAPTWEQMLSQAEPSAMGIAADTQPAPSPTPLEQVGLVLSSDDPLVSRLRIHAYLSSQSLHASATELPHLLPWQSDGTTQVLLIKGITVDQIDSLRQMLGNSSASDLIRLASSSSSSVSQSPESEMSASTQPITVAAPVSHNPDISPATRVDLLILLRPAMEPPVIPTPSDEAEPEIPPPASQPAEPAVAPH